MNAAQPSLFDDPVALPDGMRHVAELLTPPEEAELIATIAELEFRAFRFRGFEGKRRVVSFGWAYDFEGGGLRTAEPIPGFLAPARAQAAAFAGIAPDDLPHALVTEYAPGASIGWHRDRPEFGDVLGVSLGAACRFRMRRRAGMGWERRTIELEPRSAYLLRGPARTEWEHSIPPVGATRFSITFRTLRRASMERLAE